MATLNFNCESLEKRMTEGTNLSVSGLSLSVEIEINELPELVKEIPSVINAFSAAAEKSNSREWDKLCKENNEIRDKLSQSGRDLRAAEARAEAAERKAQRKQEEVEELRKKFFATPTEESEKPDIFRELRAKDK